MSINYPIIKPGTGAILKQSKSPIFLETRDLLFAPILTAETTLGTRLVNTERHSFRYETGVEPYGSHKTYEKTSHAGMNVVQYNYVNAV